MKTLSRTLLAVAALVLGVLAGAADAARFQVCLFRFNSPDECEVFLSRLPPADFDVADLTERLAPASGAAAASPARRLCRDVACDVVVFSGEFAGRFFGRGAAAVGLQELEEASCQRACDGLFRRPREVFLLACNTLATKDQDSRTAAEYLQVLLEHGFERSAAERVVALRYGPLGPSFRESFRRLFMGVPRLYGFSSVAPLGPAVAPRLERYFERRGDYAAHLDAAGRDTARNAPLLGAFAGTALVQMPGLDPDEPAAADRDLVCRLYDEAAPTRDRLELVEALMAEGDFLTFLPAIEVFLERHPAASLREDERRVLARIRAAEPARQQVLALIRNLDVSTLQLELAHFAAELEWIDHGEVRRLARDGATRLLARPLTSEGVDVLCEITRHEPVGAAFRSADLRDGLFRLAEGVRLVDCLAPADPAVDARLERALDDEDVSVRLWAAYALSRRLPLGDDVLVRLAGRVHDPPAELSDRVRWIFRAQRPLAPAAVRALRASDPALAAEVAPRPPRRGLLPWSW